MATTTCFIPILGKRIRVTKLDVCGNFPAVAAIDSYIATDGFITVTLKSVIESGQEIITRKADGSLCVNEKTADSFKRFDLDIEFCGVNPSLLAMVSNVTPYTIGTSIEGFSVPEGQINKMFALELWTGLSGQACVVGAASANGYLLLPFLQAGVLGDIKVDSSNAVSFSVTGAHTKGGNAWGLGPYKVVKNAAVDAVLPIALSPFDHLLLINTGVAPPASACGLMPMPALA